MNNKMFCFQCQETAGNKGCTLQGVCGKKTRNRWAPGSSRGEIKDFSPIIAQAKKCPPPAQIETGTITGGFAHDQVLALSDKIITAVKSGAIRKFIVMAGCDGRMKSRGYYSEFAERHCNSYCGMRQIQVQQT